MIKVDLIISKKSLEEVHMEVRVLATRLEWMIEKNKEHPAAFHIVKALKKLEKLQSDIVLATDVTEFHEQKGSLIMCLPKMGGRKRTRRGNEMTSNVIGFRARSDKRPFRGIETDETEVFGVIPEVDIEPSSVNPEAEKEPETYRTLSPLEQSMLKNRENQERLKKERLKDNGMVMKTYRIK